MSRLLFPVPHREVKLLLRGGPWFWPDADEQPGAYAEARRRWPEGPAAAVAPGATLLVAINPHTSTLALMGPLDPGTGPVHFGHGSHQAWRAAKAAVPRSADWLWNDLSTYSERGPTAWHALTIAREGNVAEPPRALEDHSFGLSFALSLASQVFGEPIHADLVASARVKPHGDTRPVKGLERKALAIARACPTVRRLLVSNLQPESDCRAVAAAGLEPVRVATVAEAFRHAFRPLPEILRRHARTAPSRERFVNGLFRLTSGARDRLIDWRPVARVARAAVGWPELTDLQRERLEIVDAVASRREGEDRPLSIPTRQLMASLPRPRRDQLVTRVVRHSAHSEYLDPSTVLQWADPYIPDRPADGYREQLLLLEAVAEVHRVSGAPERAMALYEKIARAWLEFGAVGPLLPSLAAWFRLSGALRDSTANLRAMSFHAGLEREGLSDSDDSVARLFIARAAAHVAFGKALLVTSELEKYLERPVLDEGLRHSARRVRIHTLRERGDHTLADALHDQIRAAVTDGRSEAARRSARRFDLLVELDRALLDPDIDQADRLEELIAVEPQPAGLLKASATTMPAPLYVARFYPD